MSEVKSCQELDKDPSLTCTTPLGIVKNLTSPTEATGLHTDVNSRIQQTLKKSSAFSQISLGLKQSSGPGLFKISSLSLFLAFFKS